VGAGSQKGSQDCRGKKFFYFHFPRKLEKAAKETLTQKTGAGQQAKKVMGEQDEKKRLAGFPASRRHRRSLPAQYPGKYERGHYGGV
jgi:hypothetical protein